MHTSKFRSILRQRNIICISLLNWQQWNARRKVVEQRNWTTIAAWHTRYRKIVILNWMFSITYSKPNKLLIFRLHGEIRANQQGKSSTAKFSSYHSHISRLYIKNRARRDSTPPPPSVFRVAMLRLTAPALFEAEAAEFKSRPTQEFRSQLSILLTPSISRLMQILSTQILSTSSHFYNSLVSHLRCKILWSKPSLWKGSGFKTSRSVIPGTSF